MSAHSRRSYAATDGRCSPTVGGVGSAGTNPEDTLQQALLQAWSAIRTGVEVRDPRAWLYRIVHNVAVSNHRRPVLVPVEMRDTVGANGADFEAEQRMAARDALAGLAALPDLQREVMVGTAVDGMSHEELASALGLSSGAVRGLIYRARATLRAAAAAITPGPLISWALRSGSGPGSGFYEALAGGGTAGIGGILVKGGAIAATAGAIATATGISTSHKSAHHRATPAAAVARRHVIEPTSNSVRRFEPRARGRSDELSRLHRPRPGPAARDARKLGTRKRRGSRLRVGDRQAAADRAPGRRIRQLRHRRRAFGPRRVSSRLRLGQGLGQRRLGHGQRIGWLQRGNRLDHGDRRIRQRRPWDGGPRGRTAEPPVAPREAGTRCQAAAPRRNDGLVDDGGSGGGGSGRDGGTTTTTTTSDDGGSSDSGHHGGT